jgi:mono/diheme cytochrome c family protein
MTRLKLPQRVGRAKAPGTADCMTRRPRAPLPAPSDFASVQQSRRWTAWAKAEGKIVPTPQHLGRLCPPYAAAVLMIALTAPSVAFAQTLGPPTDAEILALMKAHCVSCHAAEPTHEAFAKAPAGVLLETIPQVAANAARIMTQVVVNRAMPLGNQTGMTDEERDRIAAWIEGRNK